MLGKHATISVTVLKLQGRAKLAVHIRSTTATHHPCSCDTRRRRTTGSRSCRIRCCSLRFAAACHVVFASVAQVESLVQGHSLEQLNSLIFNQIKRSIKRKHTLPAYKIRCCARRHALRR